jgi:hypothetical protein
LTPAAGPDFQHSRPPVPHFDRNGGARPIQPRLMRVAAQRKLRHGTIRQDIFWTRDSIAT